MRWGAGLLVVACLVAGACSEGSPPELVEGAFVDPLGDVLPPRQRTVPADPGETDIETVLLRADEDVVRIKFGGGLLDVAKDSIVVEIWEDDEATKPQLRFGTRQQQVMACRGEDDAICSKDLKGTVDGSGPVIKVPRKALPKITKQTRWTFQRRHQESAGVDGRWIDVVADPPSVPDRSLAVIHDQPGIKRAVVVIQANGRPRLLIDDAPAGPATVRLYLAGDDAPISTFGLAPFREGEDVDQELGIPGRPEIPELWEVEIETAAGTTRRVGAKRL